MTRQSSVRFTTLTDVQISDLVAWWGATRTNAIAEAVSRAWHSEHGRRVAGREPMWVVLPTRNLFPDEASAIRWLEDSQSARRTGPADWVTVDEDGDLQTEWTLAIAPFTVV